MRFVILHRGEDGQVKVIGQYFQTEADAQQFAQQNRISAYQVMSEEQFHNYVSEIRDRQRMRHIAEMQEASYSPRTRTYIEEYEPEPEPEPRQQRPQSNFRFNERAPPFKPQFIRFPSVGKRRR